MNSQIKSSKHTLKFANSGKHTMLADFLQEARKALQFYIDYLWSNQIVWGDGKILDIQNNQYDIPSFISTVGIPYDSPLSARALKFISTQACGMVKAATKKHSQRLYIVNQKTRAGQDVSQSLLDKINNCPPIKPNASNAKLEMDSNCADIRTRQKGFDLCLQLKSIGKEFGKIRLPLQHHRHSRKLLSKGAMLNSFLVDEENICIRYRLPVGQKQTGAVVGADQGKTDILTLSDGQVTPRHCPHNHSLNSIIEKLSRKKRGSGAFGKAQTHRENFIHWSINQLNLTNVKQINLEKIINIGYGRNVSRRLKHWTNTLIRDKLKSAALEQEVLVVEQPSAYMSQRCSSCGLVRKANRKGKVYSCNGCGVSLDADLNAALNHEQELDYPSEAMRRHISEKRLNLGSGFYWRAGEEFTVFLSKN